MSISVAVLITYHNEGPFLAECLESLRGSKTLPDEIMIYDDASEILPEPFIPPDLSVRVIRSSVNTGPAKGRNTLLAACGSRYIHFHDADDLFAAGWCDEIRLALDGRQLDAVFTEVAPFYNGQERSEAGKASLRELAGEIDLVRFCLTHALLPAGGTYLKDRVLGIGGYSCDYWQSEDYDFHIRLAAAGLRFAVIQRPLVWQRHHPNNRSKDQIRVWSDSIRILGKLSTSLPAQYRQDVCDAIVARGRILHQIGATEEARQAFALAGRIGQPRLPGESFLYRILARSLGLDLTERLGSAYRLVLPARVRESFRAIRRNARLPRVFTGPV